MNKIYYNKKTAYREGEKYVICNACLEVLQYESLNEKGVSKLLCQSCRKTEATEEY